MSEQHAEIIAAPYTVWIAPVGTAFPAVNQEPGAPWVLLGSHGDRSYASSGVILQHVRSFADIPPPAGQTASAAAAIEREALRVRLELLDLTLEQYAFALGQNAVQTTPPAYLVPGVRSIGLSIPAGAREFAVLARGPSPYANNFNAQYELPRCNEIGSPQVVFRGGEPAGIEILLNALADPAAISETRRFGRLVAQYAEVTSFADGTFIIDGTLFGPKYGPRGPIPFLVSVWCQNPIGYCFETDNMAENLYARWKARGVNTLKHQHPDFATEGNAAAVLSACKAEGLMLIASPRWDAVANGARPGALDYRDLAMNDPYWRTNWIAYAFIDEPDNYALPQSHYEASFAGHALDGVTKPGIVNFTGRIASIVTPAGSSTINWRPFFELPSVNEIDHDVYQWHSLPDDGNVDNEATDRNGAYHFSTWNGYGIYNSVIDASLSTSNKAMRGRRFTTSTVGMATHLPRSGPMSRGFSEDGGFTILPPAQFLTPPIQRGQLVLPTALNYAPGDKAVGHYVGTGRVDFTSGSFPRGGLHQPARYVRDVIWSGIVHGSSHLLIFPQAPSGASMVMTGFVDAATQRLTITSTAPRGINNLGPSLQVTRADNGAVVGWIRRTNPQISGTPGGAGVYALDNARAATVTTGSAGSPVQLRFWAAEGTAADGTSPANAAELVAGTSNIARMQNHPTGGNLLMDPVNGGRRAYTPLRCPDINGNPRAYREDMTRAPIQAGYTSGGVPILDSAGEGPMWEFGWPMGFEGFHTVGADGATYIYVKSMSNGDRPTWFPGFAALGLPARVFSPFELVGFRRVGASAATEMAGTSGVIRANVDEGAATWFWIETAGYAQAEGSGAGTTTYNIVVRRGGNLSATNTVTATVSGAGANPANAADFGGSFPSQVLSFAANETTKTFSFTVTRDSVGEVDETFAVTLSAPSGGAVLVASGKQQITCTITNDDAAVIGAFVWLGQSLAGAPALAGSPPGAVYLNVDETTQVNRGGIGLRARGAGAAANDFFFATTPGWRMDNAFQGLELILPAGSWEIGFIAASDPFGGGIGGTVFMVDDPAGAATVRQSVVLNSAAASSQALLMNTSGGFYTNASTAVAAAIDALTYLPVTVTNLGGGMGRVQIYANSETTLAAIAARQAV